MESILNWFINKDNKNFITLCVSILTLLFGSGIINRLGNTLYKYIFGGKNEDSIISSIEYALSDLKTKNKIRNYFIRRNFIKFISLGIIGVLLFLFLSNLHKILGIKFLKKPYYSLELTNIITFIIIITILGIFFLFIVYKLRFIIYICIFVYIFILIFILIECYSIKIIDLFQVFVVLITSIITLFITYWKEKKKGSIEINETINKKKNEFKAVYYKASGVICMYISLVLLLPVLYNLDLSKKIPVLYNLDLSKKNPLLNIMILFFVINVLFIIFLFKIIRNYYNGMNNVAFIYYKDEVTGKKKYIYKKINNNIMCINKDYMKWNKKEFYSKMKKFESKIKKLYTDDIEKLIEIMIQINKLSDYSESIRVDAGCGKDYFDLLDKILKIKSDKLFNILNNKLDEMINNFEEMTVVELINEDMLVNVKIYQVRDEYQSYYFL